MMWEFWEFIVSGQVPGTSVQVTFDYWLYAVGVLLTLLIARAMWQRRRQLHDNTMPPLPDMAETSQ